MRYVRGDRTKRQLRAERSASPKGWPDREASSARSRGGPTARAFLGPRAGFTLIELIIYVGLAGAALTIITSLATSLLYADARGSARETVDVSAGRVLGQFTEALRAASAVNTSDSSFGTDAGRLSLTMRDTTRSPTIFALVSGRLEVTEAGGSAVALTAVPADVQAFRLTYLNPVGAKAGVRVELTLAFRNPGNDPRYQFRQTYVTGAVLR